MTRTRTVRSLIVVLALVVVAGAAWKALAGPSGIHSRLLLAPRLSVCGRDYNAGDGVRTRAEIGAGGGPILLVDPGILGFLVPCPAPGADGLRPCSDVALETPCATVIHVRVGEDEYVTYALSGGP